MNFFDINVMVGEWQLSELMFKSGDDLCAEMKRLGITRALVYHSAAALHTPGYAGNDYLAGEIAAHKELTGVMVATPLVGEEYGGADKLLAYMKKNNMGAIRLHPLQHSYTLLDWNMEELMELANAYSIPVLIDLKYAGGDDPRAFEPIYVLAKKYTAAPIVMLSIGYRTARSLLQLMEKCPNVSIDTSTFITYRGIEMIYKHFGSERILFGSRMPFIDGGALLGRVIYADIPAAGKENIAFNNADRLLKQNKLYSGAK